jgi:hypothetical protein
MLLGGCATRNKYFDLGEAAPAAGPHSATSIPIALVLSPAFRDYAYAHHDPNWVAVFHYKTGRYVASRLEALASASFAHVEILDQVADISALPAPVQYVVVPDFGPLTLAAPFVHAYQDAQVEASVSIQILDPLRKPVGLVSGSGTSKGTFGRAASNTPELLRKALDQACESAWMRLTSLLSQ